ncbi:MAG: NAD-dependent epimerase/dehydratase family protein [Polyangiales bacterium]
MTSIDNKTCLVTGGGGYLGSHLVRALLDRGCSVRVLDMCKSNIDEERVDWVQGDLRDRPTAERACENVDVVFHTAALIELYFRAPVDFIKRVWEVNVGGTETLLEVAARSGVQRFVHTSSTNVVFGGAARGEDETMPYTESKDLYSSTKAASERAVLLADDPNGMRTCAIRPGGIYGPGERKTIVGPMVMAVKRGVPVFCIGNPHSRLDYTYIDNLR